MVFWRKWMFGLALMLLISGAMLQAAGAESAAGGTDLGVAPEQTMTSADAAAKLGVLLGDGHGVTDAYLNKRTTRLQAAILLLRLLGIENESYQYAGTDNFADASMAGSKGRAVLGYLKSHPELGWNGTGANKFEPNASITAEQFYKVMLESLSYHSGSEFAYKDTLSFATHLGLFRSAADNPFTNRSAAAALIETLQAAPKGGTGTLLQSLTEKGVVMPDRAALLASERIDIRLTADGSPYLTDGEGRALYLYTKDMADLNSCQGQCLVNWPVVKADNVLLANGLHSADFGIHVRTNGVQQLTYKGWPIYDFIKDANAGDTKGEGVGGVWYLIKQPFYTITLGTDPKLGNYLTDGKGRTLYYFDKDPMGSSVCEGDCLAKWPAFDAGSVSVPSALKASAFGEITRKDGTKQTTFKGYPLYYFAPDASRGDLKGQGLNNVWFVVDPAAFIGTTAGKTAPVQAKATIDIQQYSFGPTELKVKAGTTIVFVNHDDVKHSAVAVNGSFKIPLLGHGESAEITLDKPGVYDYYCEPHKEFMTGRIIVE